MRNILIAAVLVCAALPAGGGDWKQFRGPGGSGTAPDEDVPAAWTQASGLRWQADLPGRGLSNPVVAGGRVYVTCSSGWRQDRLHVLCLDEKTGRRLWERQFWAVGGTQSHPKTCMAAPTPVTDGENVYAVFATFDMAALDRDGNLLWFRSLTGDDRTVGNNVGAAASPALAGDVLVLDVENVGTSFVLGVDKKTGENLWTYPRERGLNYTTPLVIERGGRTEAVIQSPDELVALDPRTGKKLWSVDGSFSTTATPIFAEGLVFAPGNPFLAVRPPEGGGRAKVAWEQSRLKTGYATPLYHKGKLYVVNSRGILACADAVTGAELWDLRTDGAVAASPVLAGDRLYVVSEEGTTTVVDVGGEKGQVVGVNRISDTVLATPVIANGAIYLRTDGHLYCIGDRQ